MSAKRGATRTRSRGRQWRSTPGRRLLPALVGICLALLASGVLLLVGRQLFMLPVSRVVVSGEMKHVDRDRVQSMISRALGGGFISQDLQTLREPLEAMPWIHRVVVRRRWPDVIEVRVIEQRAIARWGERSLLNHAGEVFSPDSLAGLSPLPRLAGPEGTHHSLMRYFLKVQQSMDALGLAVTALEMDSRGAVVARLDGAAELLFGRGALDEKLERFGVLYATRLAKRREQLARIDLRYSHGAAVAWRAVPSQHGKT